MKKLIALFCIASAVTAFADDDYTSCTNVFGVLSVNIGENVDEAIISVPWIEPSTGSGSENIAVTNVIKTANLEAGISIYYYDTVTQKYTQWVLADDKKWLKANDPSAQTSNPTLTRGNAILLKAGQGDHLPSVVYLYGQVASAASVTTTMAKGTVEGEKAMAAFTLIAPPSDTETALNSATWSNVGVGDYIRCSTNMYTYDSSTKKWRCKTGFNWDTWDDVYDYNVKIPVGQGAWYVSAASQDTTPTTVTWTSLPHVGQ